MNARGVRLSSTDLLTNYLVSVVHEAGGHEHEMRTLEERWEAIVGKLGSESVPDFLRVFMTIGRQYGSQPVSAGLPPRRRPFGAFPKSSNE
jgi:hypothetical protein